MHRVPVPRPTTTTTPKPTTTTTTTTTTPVRRPPMRPIPVRPSMASQAISSLMGMFMGQRPPTPVVQAPDPVKIVQETPIPKPPTSSFEKKERKNFADVLLEVIRPLFISIVGNVS